MRRSTSQPHRSGNRPDDDAHRPALTAINAVPSMPISMQSQSARSMVFRSMKDYSAVSNNPFFDEDSEFELMHIKITVFGLSGLLIEKHRKKSSDTVSGISSGLSTGSTITSCEDTYRATQETAEDPVYAVVTHKRNVSNSATSIASHLPSLPIGASLSSFGKVHRHAASWAANDAPLVIDEDDECSLVDQSSFTMERVMMREPYDHQRNTGATVISNFVHETVDLAINLKRGNEMIPLGVSCLVISGDEEGPLRMNLHAKEVAFKGKKVVRSNDEAGKRKVKKMEEKKKKRRLFARTSDNPYFPSDKSKEYSLDENATLKISLQVISHSSFRETEAAKERHEFNMNRLREREERERFENETYQKRLQARLSKMKLEASSCSVTGGSRKVRSESKPSRTSQYFCAPMTCVGAGKTADSKPASAGGRNRKIGNDFSLNKSSMDAYLREHGVYDDSSILSSVSESESDSDEEDPVHLLGTHIVVRKRS